MEIGVIYRAAAPETDELTINAKRMRMYPHPIRRRKTKYSQGFGVSNGRKVQTNSLKGKVNRWDQKRDQWGN
ncbi:jg1810 [Pararge aegeria aegeria]|uniref:Jg1810 protein n=1 Tax=Pararge aegeria aegeria TaxID=348720 RepID=A0A8S4QJZ4_9NEOP|nr:jg1810 [Pararge aegeria aegeria]